jgi:hypothetical protein
MVSPGIIEYREIPEPGQLEDNESCNYEDNTCDYENFADLWHGLKLPVGIHFIFLTTIFP